MTTTTLRLIVGGREQHRAAAATTHNTDIVYLPNRNSALLLMNEALARARMREASQAPTPIRSGARRPARIVTLLSKRQERI